MKDALESLAWPDLKAHLDVLASDGAVFDELLGHLRRCSRMLAKYPDPKREAKREAFFDELSKYVKAKYGADAFDQVKQVRAMFLMIENGYRSILALLEKCEVSKLLPDVRVAAYLQRANQQYKDVSARVLAAVLRRESFEVMAGAVLQDDNGNDYSPDAVSDAIVTTLTSTLLMEGFTNGWFGRDKVLIIPDFVHASDDALYKAGSTELLGICWHRWQRAEERHRFLGAGLAELSGDALPPGLPAQICRVIATEPTETWLFDFIANERLGDRLVQTFMEMSFETRVDDHAVGIDKAAPLIPAAYVSSDEAHSAVALSDLLGYSVADDQEQPAGLRLVEWLRGYAFLKCLAQQRFESSPDGVIILEESELVAGLQRVGISSHSAQVFIGHVTLALSSRDMYDCPLARTAGGKFVLFAPGLLGTTIVSVVLSNLGRLGTALSQKGSAFERSVRDFFVKNGMACQGFKVTRDGEEYEFDAIVVWGDYIFLFECKNRSLSGLNPIQAYYFDLGNRSNQKQVLRLAGALTRYPEILTDKFGPKAAGKTIVPCVLNSLPFSLPGKQDGVYFTDWSAITRFFKEKYVHAKSVHQLTDQKKLIHRAAVRSQWDGEQPTPADLLRAMDDPIQVDLVGKHTKIHIGSFPIDPETLVFSKEFMRENTTTDSFSEAMGADPKLVRADQSRVEKMVRDVRRAHQRSTLRRQDRAWRELQKRAGK